ncbi:lipoyl(octanoyl) transferase LipB [Chloroflexota bacterium]
MSCLVYNSGLTEYSRAYRLQKDIRGRVINGEQRDTLLIMEHPPTITTGVSGNTENILVSEAELAGLGISLFFTERGGDITCHAPGQLVAYPILDLTNRDRDAHRYVNDLEEVVVRTLKDFSIEGDRDESHAGIWVDNCEIAAIGISISKWVTMHGIALNINTDLDIFTLVNPCGFTDRTATSMAKLLSGEVDSDSVTSIFLKHFGEVFETRLEESPLEALTGGGNG